MENTIKFTLIVYKIDKQISDLNILLSKDPNNEELKNKLEELLSDKNLLYKGSTLDVEKIMEKYGDSNNE